MEKKKLKGAEAIVTPCSFCGMPAVRKERLPKSYRPQALDQKIRKSRTKVEARLLARAKEKGVRCPLVYAMDEFTLTMEKLEGKTLNGSSLTLSQINAAASILSSLHSLGIIHGDFTPANLMGSKGNLAVIDFGLGFISSDNEPKAVDLLTMKKALGAQGKKFVLLYEKHGGSRQVVSLMEKVDARARYQERSG